MRKCRSDELAPTKHVEDFDDEAKSRAKSDSRISLVGQLFSDRYRIERRIGEGAMGEVYLAEHTLMHKRVAIKVLHARMGRKADVVARFEREAVAASHIDHPNIVTATDFGQTADGTMFLVLEYLEGISLRDAIVQYGALPPKRALHIATQICSALVSAHALGIVHRDLKPENVMLIDRGDDPDFVKVLDFGIARVPMNALASGSDSGTLTRAGMVHGTPEYIAPEQALGEEVDARADLYALGIVLYEMLTGRRPFAAPNDLLLLSMQATAPVPPMIDRAPLVTVDPLLEAFVRRLLAKKPNDRPADAHATEALLLEFEAKYRTDLPRKPSYRPPAISSLSLSAAQTESGELSAHSASVRVETGSVPPGKKGRSKLLTFALLAAGLVTALGTFGLVVRAGRGNEPHPLTSSEPKTALAILPAPTTELPQLERSMADALRHFEECDVAKGRALLERAQSRHDLPQLQKAAASGCFAKGNVKDALAALSVLASTKPDEAVAAPFLAEVEHAATVEATMNTAYKLLEGSPSPAVADVLYRLTLPPNIRPSIARAEKALQQPAIRAEASRPLAIALALKEAGQGCEAVQLFDEAEKFGDGRALAYLDLLEPLHSISYRKMPGKKAPVPTDAYACLHKNGALAKAITAIKGRLARSN